VLLKTQDLGNISIFKKTFQKFRVGWGWVAGHRFLRLDINRQAYVRQRCIILYQTNRENRKVLEWVAAAAAAAVVVDEPYINVFSAFSLTQFYTSVTGSATASGFVLHALRNKRMNITMNPKQVCTNNDLHY